MKIFPLILAIFWSGSAACAELGDVITKLANLSFNPVYLSRIVVEPETSCSIPDVDREDYRYIEIGGNKIPLAKFLKPVFVSIGNKGQLMFVFAVDLAEPLYLSVERPPLFSFEEIMAHASAKNIDRVNLVDNFRDYLPLLYALNEGTNKVYANAELYLGGLVFVDHVEKVAGGVIPDTTAFFKFSDSGVIRLFSKFDIRCNEFFDTKQYDVAPFTWTADFADVMKRYEDTGAIDKQLLREIGFIVN